MVSEWKMFGSCNLGAEIVVVVWACSSGDGCSNVCDSGSGLVSSGCSSGRGGSNSVFGCNNIIASSGCSEFKSDFDVERVAWQCFFENVYDSFLKKKFEKLGEKQILGL